MKIFRRFKWKCIIWIKNLKIEISIHFWKVTVVSAFFLLNRYAFKFSGLHMAKRTIRREIPPFLFSILLVNHCVSPRELSRTGHSGLFPTWAGHSCQGKPMKQQEINHNTNRKKHNTNNKEQETNHNKTGRNKR